MTSHARKLKRDPLGLRKDDPTLPALIVTGPQSIAIRAGTMFAGHTFRKQTPIALRALVHSDTCFIAGSDYGVVVRAGKPFALRVYRGLPVGEEVIAGFHFAPGGNAPARAGGDEIPAINPRSLWDTNFRPACPDPRGTFFINGPAGPAWLDIYKLGKDHLIDGTSKFGVTIADGNDPPQNPAGGYFDRLDYDTAVAVMKHHGKTLASVDELMFAADGVTEKIALGHDPKITGLDAPRTSQFGMMQATGSIWDWCHDGSLQPRPSIFGGSWLYGGSAGSRCALVGYWPGHSNESLGARGRSDHLQLV
jgi:hypothetical protein